MSDSCHQVTKCRTCGQEDWQQVISFGELPLANNFLESASSYDDEPVYPLGIMSCRSCRLMSLTHAVDPELIFRFYTYVSPTSPSTLQQMKKIVARCGGTYGLVPDDLVVEIGSNTGTQLQMFLDAGTRVLGIDPAENIAAIANANGIETVTEFFSRTLAEQVAERHGKASVVLGRNVFAHIDNLADVADGVRCLLALDGVFAIETTYILDMLKRKDFDTIYHEHVSYFSVGTLVDFLGQHGLRVIDVERVSMHGGSILVYAGLADGPYQRQPAVDELIALEEREGVRSDDSYRNWARDVQQMSADLARLVRGLAADGKRVAGYGAPAKGSTLLSVCGLGPSEVEFVSDTTLFKQGKVLPGTHIPVRSPGYAKAHTPDYYLLLAWNYADEIMSKEREYVEAGGKFIIPHPHPSIVSPTFHA